jgi:2-(1,2-epoxy-1,2-dihydrophenyl)acetyl-CoA isomerase
MPYKNLKFEIRDNVAHLTLARPEAANAIDLAMAQELSDAAIRCDESPEVRAVLITAEGRMFSAGGDIRAFAEDIDGLPTLIKKLTVPLHAAISRLTRMRAPVVTAVAGPAAGAGFSLALSGDIVLAAESAKFTMAYTAVGLSPDGSSSWFLPRLIGQRRTAELMLTNRTLTAAEAADWGLITRAVADEELIAEAERVATTLAKGPTLAHSQIKTLLAGSMNQSLETQMELEARGIAAMTATEDGREGIAAFIAKRRPEFKGR